MSFSGTFAATYTDIAGNIFTYSDAAHLTDINGNTYTYTDSGTVTITAFSFAASNAILPSSVPTTNDSVSSISSSVFQNVTTLINVTLPNNLVTIGSSAFKGCSSLVSLVFPNSLQKISDFAFEDCTSLASVSFPQLNSFTIGYGGFMNCGFVNLTIPANLDRTYDTSGMQLLFAYNVHLVNLSFANGCTSIGLGYAGWFTNCTSLTTVYIPSYVTSIVDGSFTFDTSLTSVYFAGNAPNFGHTEEGVFYGSPNVHVYYLYGSNNWPTSSTNLSHSTVIPQTPLSSFPVPVVTSALSVSGTVGVAFTYYITGTNTPTSYTVSGLPAGLTLNTSTGLISGTPTIPAVTNINIAAANAIGSSITATLVLTIGKPTPTITAAPTASSITYGQTLASSSLTGGTASVAGTFAFTNTGVAPALGTSTQSVTFTPTDTTNYNSVTTNVSVNVGKAPAGISISNTTQTYTGKPLPVTTSLSPSTLSAAVVYYPGFNVPTDAGTYYVLVNVVDNTYYGSQSSVLTILPAAQTVSVVTPSSLRVGVPTTLLATSTSNGPISYSVVSGNATVSGSTLIAKDTNPIVIQANQAGTNDYQASSVTATIAASAYSPVAITSNPTNQLVRSGSSATFIVNATGTSPTYQWNLNGTPIAGATSASYTVTASSSTTGNYTCTISNAAGSVTTPAATLTLNTTHLQNLSARSIVGTSNLSVGFVSAGSAAKSILLRGDGPSLVNYGVSGVLASPTLTLYTSAGASIASNSAWGGSSTLSTIFTQVGAFPLTATSNDAVLNQSLSSGTYSAIVTGANSSTGAAMVEIYDADPTGATSRLVNISARGMVGTGSSIMTGGFVITGNSTETVLIRAVGPTLSTYGVTGVLAQPTLTVYNSSGTSVASNTIWGGGSTLSSAMTQVGAFALPATSADSAALVTLPAGAYTVQVSGVNGTTGNALLEIYEVSSP